MQWSVRLWTTLALWASCMAVTNCTNNVNPSSHRSARNVLLWPISCSLSAGSGMFDTAGGYRRDFRYFDAFEARLLVPPFWTLSKDGVEGTTRPWRIFCGHLELWASTAVVPEPWIPWTSTLLSPLTSDDFLRTTGTISRICPGRTQRLWRIKRQATRRPSRKRRSRKGRARKHPRMLDIWRQVVLRGWTALHAPCAHSPSLQSCMWFLTHALATRLSHHVSTLQPCRPVENRT